VNHLIAPYGGRPVNLQVSAERVEALRQEAFALPSIDLDWRQIGELEMLMSGAYAPLTGYMGRGDYEYVLEKICLADGTAWPLPLTLQLGDRQIEDIKAGSRVALRDSEGFMLAVLTVTDFWQSDPAHDHQLLDRSGLAEGIELRAGIWHVGGSLEGVSTPMHHDFTDLRLTPGELRAQLARRGWRKIVAYPARQPMHRAQFEFCLRTAIGQEANLLLLPFGGGDLASQTGYFTLMRTFQAIMPRFPAATTQLAMLPIAPHAPSLREKLLRAILARNYGCTHVIVGGEHEIRGEQRRGSDVGHDHGGFNVVAEAHRFGVTVVPFPRMKFVEDRAEYLPESDLPEDTRAVSLGGEEFQRRLRGGLKIPDWYAFPEVIEEIQRTCPPRDRQGFTVFFTGLSGAGKSTLARALAIRLMEMGGRPVTLLDGDVVRRHLSAELGFSREHRDINVRRIGFVASEITKNRGVAICAPIAPYRQTRRDVRAMIEAVGGFIEVHVSTPIETCEARDRKGLYAKARAGLIPEFTGVSDPYEVPEKAEVLLDTTAMTVDEAVQHILLKLEHEGYLR
jgi:sulfate adenylyltransferase